MKLMMKLVTRILCAGAFVFAASALSAAEFDKNQEVVLKSENLEFANINEAIRMAHAYGNRGEGAHGSFGRFPANFTTPVHTHSGAYHGVVIKGVMTNPFENEKKPQKMKPGSYWYVPAGSVHTTACVSDTPCEFYFHADGAFDFTPVEE